MDNDIAILMGKWSMKTGFLANMLSIKVWVTCQQKSDTFVTKPRALTLLISEACGIPTELCTAIVRSSL